MATGEGHCDQAVELRRRTGLGFAPTPAMAAGRQFALWTLAVFLVAPPLAVAQGVGFQGGGTVSPNQFYVGSHLEVPLGSPQLVLRPSIDGGSGGGVTLASINFELLYRFDLPANGWAIYQGTGPAVNVVRFREQTDVRGGFNLVFGVRHESGFFSELKVGGSGSPSLRYGIGFTVNTGPSRP